METGQAIFFEAKFIVDASGRDTFLANKYKTKQKNKNIEVPQSLGIFIMLLDYKGTKRGISLSFGSNMVGSGLFP